MASAPQSSVRGVSSVSSVSSDAWNRTKSLVGRPPRVPAAASLPFPNAGRYKVVEGDLGGFRIGVATGIAALQLLGCRAAVPALNPFDKPASVAIVRRLRQRRIDAPGFAGEPAHQGDAGLDALPADHQQVVFASSDTADDMVEHGHACRAAFELGKCGCHLAFGRCLFGAPTVVEPTHVSLASVSKCST